MSGRERNEIRLLSENIRVFERDHAGLEFLFFGPSILIKANY